MDNDKAHVLIEKLRRLNAEFTAAVDEFNVCFRTYVDDDGVIRREA